MECYKCGKQLTLYGSSAICQCRDCKRYFCENEGEILNAERFIEVAKGNVDRIAYDFLCYGCEAKKGTLKDQNEKLAKATEERERAEMLNKQRLHSSDNWEVRYEDLEKLPEIGEISYMRKGFHGEVRSCSVYDRFYGSKWPALDTRIYLVLIHSKPSNNYYEKPIKTTEYFCRPCVKRFLKDWWSDLEYGFIVGKKSKTFKEKFPDLDK